MKYIGVFDNTLTLRLRCAVLHERRLGDCTPNVLLTSDVCDKVLQCEETLQAGVDVAVLYGVGEPDTQTQRVKHGVSIVNCLPRR